MFSTMRHNAVYFSLMYRQIICIPINVFSTRLRLSHAKHALTSLFQYHTIRNVARLSCRRTLTRHHSALFQAIDIGPSHLVIAYPAIRLRLIFNEHPGQGPFPLSAARPTDPRFCVPQESSFCHIDISVPTNPERVHSFPSQLQY